MATLQEKLTAFREKLGAAADNVLKNAGAQEALAEQIGLTSKEFQGDDTETFKDEETDGVEEVYEDELDEETADFVAALEEAIDERVTAILDEVLPEVFEAQAKEINAALHVLKAENDALKATVKELVDGQPASFKGYRASQAGNSQVTTKAAAPSSDPVSDFVGMMFTQPTAGFPVVQK